jgi:hypothetical protein
MKGIVFNLLEQVVSDAHGEETWDALLAATGTDGSYTSVGNYEDDEFKRLLAAAIERLGQPEENVVRWFGRQALPLLAARYPTFFQGHAGTRSFLLTLNDVIHPEVRKLFPGAYAPEFEFDTSGGEDVLKLGYISHRNLCWFGEGLIEGAGAHFGESLEVDQSECTQRGDARCVFVCRFGGG